MNDKKQEEKKDPKYDPRKKFVDDGVGMIIYKAKKKKIKKK